MLRRAPAVWSLHPGEILREEFVKPLGLSGYSLAKGIAVPAQAVNDIILEKRGISAEMAVRLARFFGTSEEFWSHLQSSYELTRARKKLGKSLAQIVAHGAA
ncbi:MAG: HigA family addiction module antitoxin [Vulcanimicrobiaceae bacterium]